MIFHFNADVAYIELQARKVTIMVTLSKQKLLFPLIPDLLTEKKGRNVKVRRFYVGNTGISRRNW